MRRYCPLILTQCADCGLGCITAGEWFMATDEVWEAAWAGRRKPWHALPGQQVLCVGCLETRIGRTLTANDFLPVVLNDPGHGYKSDRLLDRLAGADWRERLAGQDWQDCGDVSEPEDTLFGDGKKGLLREEEDR